MSRPTTYLEIEIAPPKLSGVGVTLIILGCLLVSLAVILG